MNVDLRGEPVDLSSCSRAVLRKAQRFIAAEKVHAVNRDEGLWMVEGSTPGSTYAVRLGRDDEGSPWWSTCTCPYGSNRRDGRPGCSHQVAVWITLSSERDDGPRDDGQPAGDHRDGPVDTSARPAGE